MEITDTIEEHLGRIEIGIRHLKLQYDMFFTGHLKRQPFESRKELEVMIETLGKTPMQRFADRFRYNTLASKYQTMVELWSKMIRAKEEGRLKPGIPGFVQQVRPPEAALNGNGAGPRAPESFRFRDPGAEDEKCRMFYDRYIQATRNGASGSKSIPFEKFRRQIEAKAKVMKQRSRCDAVTYSIEKKGDRVVLKMRPAKERGRS